MVREPLHDNHSIRQRLILPLLLLLLTGFSWISVGTVFAETCNHKWTVWETDFEATCSEDGQKSRYCEECGTIETETIPETGKHVWGDWEVTVDATCSEAGTMERSCETCYQMQSKSVPATGKHSWSDWDVTELASCSKAGEKVRYCDNCSKTETKKIPATGKHRWTSWETDEEPTCTKAGTSVRTCEDCDKTETKAIPKTGKHVWGDWKVTKEATIKKSGLKERQCEECGKVQKKATPKLRAFAKFTKKNYTVKAGKTLKLKVKYANGDKIKKFRTSKKSVATVNAKGKVRAKAGGTAKITVIMQSGKKATCRIKVKAPKKKSSSGTNSGSGWDGTVYWTPSGSVYHKSKSCPTLSRSRTVYSGSIAESGRARACKVCS